MEKARQSGSTIEYMTPDKYIRKTGLNPEENSNYYYDYLEKYYDDEKEESRPIKELSDLIKNPKKKITIPYVGESPCEHEGRHRAYAAKLAGYKKIPVVVPSLKNYSMEERTKLGEKFVKIKGYVGSYAHEWIGRFERGNPESYMDSSNRKILVKMLKEEKKWKRQIYLNLNH